MNTLLFTSISIYSLRFGVRRQTSLNKPDTKTLCFKQTSRLFQSFARIAKWAVVYFSPATHYPKHIHTNSKITTTTSPANRQTRNPVAKFMRQWHSSPFLIFYLYGGHPFSCFYFSLIRIIIHIFLFCQPAKDIKRWKIFGVCARASVCFFCLLHFCFVSHLLWQCSHFGSISFQTLIYNNSLAFVIRTRIYISHGNSL